MGIVALWAVLNVVLAESVVKFVVRNTVLRNAMPPMTVVVVIFVRLKVTVVALPAYHHVLMTVNAVSVKSVAHKAYVLSMYPAQDNAV